MFDYYFSCIRFVRSPCGVSNIRSYYCEANANAIVIINTMKAINGHPASNKATPMMNPITQINIAAPGPEDDDLVIIIKCYFFLLDL